MTLDELKRLHEAASPGPWEVRSRFDIYAAGYYVGTTRGNDDLPPYIAATDAANAALIAAARNALPALIECAQELEDLLCEMSAPYCTDPRIGYDEIQVTKGQIAKARAALARLNEVKP